ncbi:MAG: hypothetical protein CL878_14005 [Dehalococcoidia bacterium]|nr:hypothetical protein [Dehalococcoidia bacterium]
MALPAQVEHVGPWQQAREERAPAVGALAPDFALERLSPIAGRTGRQARLSDHQGRPVALVFGSYT